jgi:hypothetical protein
MWAMLFKEQAENCRRQAAQYVGRAEAPFLLRVASVFDELAVSANSGLIAQRERRRNQDLAPNARA